MANHSTAFERSLLKSRRLFLWDDVDADSAKHIIQQIKCLWRKDDTKPLYLYIHSNGGSCDAGAAIIDEIAHITAVGGEFYTIANGNACSAAAEILGFGTPGYRYATPNSTIMMHSAACELYNDKLHEHKGYIDYYTKRRDEMVKNLAKACGKGSGVKFKQFAEDVKNTIWLTSKEALKYGLIDGIWTPQLEERVNQDERDAIDAVTEAKEA